MGARLTLPTATYADADERLGKRDRLRVGHNTILRRAPGGIAVRYHSTDVVTYRPDGWTVIDTAGWWTVTTWTRVNAALPSGVHVHSVRGVPTLHVEGQPIVQYQDGIAVRTVLGYDVPEVGNTSGGWTPAGAREVATILTVTDVSRAIADGRERQAQRAAQRAERFGRQHSGEVSIAELETIGERIIAAARDGREPLALHTERFDLATRSPHGRANAWDCPTCAPRREVRRHVVREVLGFEHTRALAVLGTDDATSGSVPFGSHRFERAVTRWEAPREYGAAMLRCPWECPKRSNAY